MNCWELPIFNKLNKESREYLQVYYDKFEAELKKHGIVLNPESMLGAKMDMFSIFEMRVVYGSEEVFIEKFDEFMDDVIKKRDYTVNYDYLMTRIYNTRRLCANTTKMTEDEYSDMLEKWEKNDSGLSVRNSFGWVYKTSPHYDKKNLHRFILNVDVTPELLHRLDEFAVKYACQFKCAGLLSETYGRPDSILIYTSDLRVKEQISELQNLIRPYVRENGDNKLDGDKICPGLFVAKEPDIDDIKLLVAKANKVSPQLAQAIEKGVRLPHRRGKSHPLSLGEFTVYQDILQMLERIQSDKHIAFSRKGWDYEVFEKSWPGHPRYYEITVKKAQEKHWLFLYDKDNGEYRATNCITKERFSSNPDSKVAPLPPEYYKNLCEMIKYINFQFAVEKMDGYKQDSKQIGPDINKKYIYETKNLRTE